MSIVPPPNDTACLSRMIAEVAAWARTPEAAALAAELGTLDRVVEWLQALPQADDDGARTVDSIKCDVYQRLRRFPRDPNCFERTAAFLTVASLIAPSLRFTAITVDTPAGRHTAPLLLTDAGPMVVNLSPHPRNAEWYQDLFEVLHTVGRAVLTFYGGQAGGALGDEVGEWERKAGLRAPASPPPPPPKVPQQSPSTGTPAPSVAVHPLPAATRLPEPQKEEAWRRSATETGTAPATAGTAPITAGPPRSPDPLPSSSSGSSRRDEPSPATPSTGRRFGLAPSAWAPESEVGPWPR